MNFKINQDKIPACKGMDTNIFFPEEYDRAINPLAIDTCKKCPIRLDCLTRALQNKEEYGVWAGTTPSERRYIRKKKVNPRDYLNVTCGTVDGYLRHRRLQTTVCKSCKQAFNDEQKRREVHGKSKLEV